MEEITTAKGNPTVGVPLETGLSEANRNKRCNVTLVHDSECGKDEHTFSDRRKSLVSSRSISLTPGFRTMLLIGRLCLESVQRHDP